MSSWKFVYRTIRDPDQKGARSWIKSGMTREGTSLRMTTRHLGMDWLRIGAFGLLILYHIGMYFVPWGWHVKIAAPLDWVAIPMLATNSWRLARSSGVAPEWALRGFFNSVAA